MGVSPLRRRTNIDYADSLEPHDHVVWFGDGVSELYEVASAAFVDGARRGEKLMFVAERPDPARFRGIDGLGRLLDNGQLELLEIDSVYGTGSGLSASEQLATFEGVLDDALSEGYAGIRVVADNTPLARGDDESFRRWLEWEQLTDRFQAASLVTGVCYFDRTTLSEERQADLAALHPVRGAGDVEPSFSWFADGDAVRVNGALDALSAQQLRRVLDTVPTDGPLVIDLSHAEFVDHHALYVLAQSATADRPLHIRGGAHLRKLASLIGAPD